MDIDSSAKKIKIVREELGFSQVDFSKELDIPQPYLSSMEAGKKGVTLKFCTLLMRKFNVNVNWILSGSSDMFIKRTEETGSKNAGSDVTLDLSDDTSVPKKKVNITVWV